MKVPFLTLWILALPFTASADDSYKIICQTRSTPPVENMLDDSPPSASAKLAVAKLGNQDLISTQDQAAPNRPYTIQVPTQEGRVQLIFQATEAQIEFEVSLHHIEGNPYAEIWARDQVTNLASAPILDLKGEKWGVSLRDSKTQRGALLSCKFAK